MKNQSRDLKRSPLHYNGNKYSIAEVLLGIFGNKGKIIEPFGGTGIISLNSNAQEIWINDNNKKLISLIKFIKNISQKDIDNLIQLTNHYKLTSDLNDFSHLRKSKGTKGYSELNKHGYNLLKSDYNENQDVLYLFLLMNYSFNRMIRFNSSGKFNVPVGKGDFSKRQIKYTLEYSSLFKDKKVKITSMDYKKVISKATKNDFLYIDPPYLNGTAQYNISWGMEEEKELYDNLDKLHSQGIHFALSNTLFNNGNLNSILNEWIEKNNYIVINIDKKYSKTSYNKKNRYDAKEILVINEVDNGI